MNFWSAVYLVVYILWYTLYDTLRSILIQKALGIICTVVIHEQEGFKTNHTVILNPFAKVRSFIATSNYIGNEILRYDFLAPWGLIHSPNSCADNKAIVGHVCMAGLFFRSFSVRFLVDCQRFQWQSMFALQIREHRRLQAQAEKGDHHCRANQN